MKAKHDWTAMRMAWVNGSMSLTDLASAHGAVPSTVRKRASRERWTDERRKMTRLVTDSAQEPIIERRVGELAEINRADLSLARDLREQVAARLRDSAQPGASKLTATELARLSVTAANAQRLGRLALGVSTDNHGHGGPGGEGPVGITSVPVDAYLRARAQALRDF